MVAVGTSGMNGVLSPCVFLDSTQSSPVHTFGGQDSHDQQVRGPLLTLQHPTMGDAKYFVRGCGASFGRPH